MARWFAVSRYLWRFARAVWSLKADVYYAKLASLESMTVWAVAKLRGARFAFRIASNLESNFPDLVRHIFGGRRRQARLFVQCLRRCDVVICQTQEQQQTIAREYGVQCIRIPNSHELPPKAPDSRRESVLWVSRSHPVKRPHLLLDLAQMLPDRHFVMIMPPAGQDDALFAQTQERARSLPNVEFIPGVAQREILPYFRSARVFVLTSEVEGFSNVLIEAFKTATPVVSLSFNPDGLLRRLDESAEASPSPPPPGDACVGYCAGGQLERMADLVRMLFEKEAVWQDCSNEAFRYAEECFDVRSVIKVYKELLRK